MFYKYKIVNNTLYLYVDEKCEIGSFFSDGKNSLVSKIKNYIKEMKIKFNGTKVVLILSGLMLGTVYLNNDIKKEEYDVYKDNKYVYNIVDKSVPNIDKKSVEKIEEIIENVDSFNNTGNVIKNADSFNGSNSANKNINKEVINQNKESYNNKKYEEKNTENVLPSKQENTINYETYDTSDDIIVSVHRSNGEVLNLKLEDYIVGVVGAEMPASFNIEALKAQAVIARTYTKKLISSGRIITDDVRTQSYKSDIELKNMWGSSYNVYLNKIKTAVLTTKAKYLTYNGEVIDAVYHSTSNGYTEDAINVWGNSVPYLKTVTSPWDTSCSTFLRNTDISFEELSKKLELDFNLDTLIEIISRDESGRISKIKVGEKEFTGVNIRNLLGLRSADFDVLKKDGYVTFTTRGYGHGVGMSQYGANKMAESGYNYEQILRHYYTNIEITNF